MIRFLARFFRGLRPFKAPRPPLHAPPNSMGGWKLGWTYLPVAGGLPGQVAPVKMLVSPNGRHCWPFTSATGRHSDN